MRHGIVRSPLRGRRGLLSTTIEALAPALAATLSWAAAPRLAAAEADRAAGSELALETRRRVESPETPGAWRLESGTVRWKPAETAIIICDMWDRHWCAGATRRVAEMAPRMDEVVAKARAMGVLIVHAPSETMKTYEGHPARRRAREAPRAADLPDGIAGGCGGIPAESRSAWPIDQSDGGCDCEPQCRTEYPWKSQIASIGIRDEDAISDSGVEIWNLFSQRGIRNVVLMGVHTNMCVIGRPFGLRNLVRFGKNVVLMRDMTDTMYNSRKAPEVSHFTGTDLVIAHIEKHVCPTVASTALTGKDPFRFAEDRRKRVIFISAENEYGAADTLPAFARTLELEAGVATEVLQASTAGSGPGRHFVPGMRALSTADLVILFARRRALPAEDMKRFREYLERGGPLIALRTSSHGLAPREPIDPGLEAWETFDREVLGCRYDGYPHGEDLVSVAPEAKGHPIVAGLEGPWQVRETLYKSLPLAPTCKVLLTGRCVDGAGDEARYRKEAGDDTPEQPVAWTNVYRGAKVFYTSLGSAKASFPQPWFRTMLRNAVAWALGETPAPAAPAR